MNEWMNEWMNFVQHTFWNVWTITNKRSLTIVLTIYPLPSSVIAGTFSFLDVSRIWWALNNIFLALFLPPSLPPPLPRKTPQITPNHPKSSQIIPNRPQMIPNHPKSPQITPNHPPNHPKSPQITVCVGATPTTPFCTDTRCGMCSPVSECFFRITITNSFRCVCPSSKTNFLYKVPIGVWLCVSVLWFVHVDVRAMSQRGL